MGISTSTFVCFPAGALQRQLSRQLGDDDWVTNPGSSFELSLPHGQARGPGDTRAETSAIVPDMTRDIVEELLSQDRAGRARLVRRPDGLIQVEIERQVPGDEHGPAYWSRFGHQVIVADTIERARGLAREGLAGIT
jgi:hypothetical protein